MFIKLNNTNYNRKLVKCLFARGGKWYAELVNGEQFTISQSDFQTATDGMNAINGVYYFADVIAKVEVELKEEPSPEPPSGDLTPFAVGQTLTGIAVDTSGLSGAEIDSWLDTFDFTSQDMYQLIEPLGDSSGMFVGGGSVAPYPTLIIMGQVPVYYAREQYISDGLTVPKGWSYMDSTTQQAVQFSGYREVTFASGAELTITNVSSELSTVNGILLGAIADASTKLLKAETTADYTAHFKNGNTFPIDGTTFNQVTADFCQIGGAYYNPSIINRLYATKQPKYFVEFVNGQTLEITAEEYYNILGISGAKIEVGADLSVLFGNRAMENAEVLIMLSELTYTDGKAVLATNSDGVELITAMNNSTYGYQIVLYNEFMPIWTEKGYKGMPAGWCGTDTVVDGKQFTFVEADGTVKLAEYLQLFDVGEVDLTVATVADGDWNPLLVGAIQEE